MGAISAIIRLHRGHGPLLQESYSTSPLDDEADWHFHRMSCSPDTQATTRRNRTGALLRQVLPTTSC